MFKFTVILTLGRRLLVVKNYISSSISFAENLSILKKIELKTIKTASVKQCLLVAEHF